MTTYRSPWPAVEIPDVSLPDHILRTAGDQPDKPALVDGPSGRTITYGELALGVQLLAAGLAQRGFGKGDVFAIYLPNVPEYAVALYGVAKAGGIATTINPLYTVDELTHQLTDAGARYLLTIPLFLDKARAAAERAGIEEVFVLGEAEGATPVMALLANDGQLPEVAVDPDDVVVLPYSSGTTGLPKGVMVSHRNIVANCVQCQPILSMQDDDRVLAVLPFFHIYGMVVLLSMGLSNGATLVTMPRFDLKDYLQLLQDQRITYAFIVPPIGLALARHPMVEEFDLSALRLVNSGAAPMSAELEEAIGRRIGTLSAQGYGMTETATVLSANPLDEAQVRHGSVGRLLPNVESRVVDPVRGEDVAEGEQGELWFRGPNVVKGYLNNPAATASTFDADGWIHTGDIGYFDAEGYLYVVDRVKELIKYKGLQIAPAELEAVLVQHPAIADAAVIRVPDEEAGEIPKAFLVARSEVAPEDVMAFVAERVAPYKKVRRIEFVDEIPKSASGKILRRVLMAKEAESADR